MRQWATRGGDIVYGRQVSGGTALVQRHEHMLRTTPGELLSDAEWGIGLDSVLGENDVDTASLAAIAEAQHKTDPETVDASVTITEEPGSKLKHSGTFTANDGTVAPLTTVIE
jgi:hypothetical protein